jgi:hypothetical protein
MGLQSGVWREPKRPGMIVTIRLSGQKSLDVDAALDIE